MTNRQPSLFSSIIGILTLKITKRNLLVYLYEKVILVQLINSPIERVTMFNI